MFHGTLHGTGDTIHPTGIPGDHFSGIITTDITITGTTIITDITAVGTFTVITDGMTFITAAIAPIHLMSV